MSRAITHAVTEEELRKDQLLTYASSPNAVASPAAIDVGHLRESSLHNCHMQVKRDGYACLAAHVDWGLHEDVLGQGVVTCLGLGHGKHAGCRHCCLHCHPMLLAPVRQRQTLHATESDI